MKKTFKEKAVSKAAGLSRKHKFMKPFIFLVLLTVLGVYNVVKYFGGNGKKYISIGFVLVFFLLCSSFTNADAMKEGEVYLSSAGGVDIYEDSIPLNEDTTQDVSEYVQISEDSSGDEYTSDESAALSDTDMFSLDDFLFDYTLSDSASSESSDGNGFSKDDWSLILVNKTHPIPDDYEVKLTVIKGSMRCDERAVEPLRNMLNAANAKGISLYVCSPYRDGDRQEMLFNRRINQYMDNGKSYLEAFKTASKDVIIPGCSEHQLGLAFDIVCSYHSTLDWEFGDTEAGKWLYEHCAEYGFILRYPKGKESITGIVYEPWHFRYVGTEAAKYIMENGITLEELWEEF
ncbi:MAG: M15 family metallopeptidase [Lachnospiraceae bacterium]|nr:M15 family metallopeptidase [Lachnospiraceae bacterium]